MSNTRITLHSSGVSGNTPSLGVLANGEVSLNFADGILYYKTDSNTLGSIQTTEPSGLSTEIQFNDSGSFGSSNALTFNSDTRTLNVENIHIDANLSIDGDINPVDGEIIFNGNLDVNGNIVVNQTTTSNVFVANNYIQFGDGTQQTTAATGALDSNTANLTADTANQVIDIFNSTTYTSAKYITQAYAYFAVEDLEIETSANVDLQTSSAAAEDLESSIGDKEYEMNEIMVLTNGRESFIQETSNLRSDVSLGTYYTDMDGDSVRLLYSPAYVNTNVSVKRISIAA